MTTTVGLLSPLLPPSAVTAAVAEEHRQEDYYYVPQPQPARVVRMKMWSDDDDDDSASSSYCADDGSTVSISIRGMRMERSFFGLPRVRTPRPVAGSGTGTRRGSYPQTIQKFPPTVAAAATRPPARSPASAR